MKIQVVTSQLETVVGTQVELNTVEQFLISAKADKLVRNIEQLKKLCCENKHSTEVRVPKLVLENFMKHVNDLVQFNIKVTGTIETSKASDALFSEPNDVEQEVKEQLPLHEIKA